MVTPLLERIREGHAEGMKEDLQKCERVIGWLDSFDYDSCGLLTMHRRIWVPYWGGVRQVLMEEAHKSRFSMHPEVTKMY